MASRSGRSKPPSEPKADTPCPDTETFTQALARLRSEAKTEISPVLLRYLNDAAAQRGGTILAQLINSPWRGLRILPPSCDLPPLP